MDDQIGARGGGWLGEVPADVLRAARWTDARRSLATSTGPVPALPAPSRVAFAGCWHAHPGRARRAMRAAAARGATTLVHTGDFAYAGGAATALIAAVQRTADDLDMTVVVVRGNHDDPDLYEQAVQATGPTADGFARLAPRVLHAPNGHTWTWQGVRFAALGGAHSVDRAARVAGVSWWPGETATDADIDTVAALGDLDVLVTHDCPAGVDLPFPPHPPGWWDLAGARADAARLARAADGAAPAWIICGHLHFRHSGQRVSPRGAVSRVEVLDMADHGIAGNLLIADLAGARLTPLP